jgi:ribose-phosphate pyrophosphokinase
MSVKLNNTEVGTRGYPNNERIFEDIALNIRQNGNTAHVFVAYQRAVDFETFSLLVSYINTLPKVEAKILDMWYIPYLRMDRQVGRRDPMIQGISHLLATICRGWRVRTLDPHPNDPGWAEGIDNVEYIPLQPFIDRVIRDCAIAVICFPDDGALKKYSNLLNVTLPVVSAKKERDIDTGRITSITLCSPRAIDGKRVLIIDDICSYGGTSNTVARLLKDRGASRVVAWFSHTEFSIERGGIFTDGYLDHVYTTNSILDKALVGNMTILTLDNHNNTKTYYGEVQ